MKRFSGEREARADAGHPRAGAKSLPCGTRLKGMNRGGQGTALSPGSQTFGNPGPRDSGREKIKSKSCVP